jgi:hypothetical protein
MIVGGLAMLAGAADPMEGSVIIFAGCCAVTPAIFLRPGDRGLRIEWILIFILIAIGVGALFALSGVGGIGGNSGRSMWWGLLVLPYPIGWVLGVVSLVFQLIRGIRHRHARRDG